MLFCWEIRNRDDHFPEVLIQNPDAASKLRRSFQIGVFRVNRFYINAIVSFQVKIVFPERLELFLAAVKAHGLTFLVALRYLSSARI